MRDYNQIFKTYKKRMTISAITSSVCYGLITGGGVAFVSALLCWIFNYNNIWIAVGAGAGSALAAGILLFFLKFRPDAHAVARRIDTMGLEERTITMFDLQNSDSSIAEIQRRDAISKISGVTDGQVKRAFPVFAAGKAAAVVLGVSLCAGIGMTVVTGLTAVGIIPGPDIIPPVQDKFVIVTYLAEEGGEIEGETDQVISPGEDAMPVVAVAEDGWVFIRWSDGNQLTGRTDKYITSDLTVTAIFDEIGEGEGDEDGDSIENDSDGDYDSHAPDPDENEGPGGNGEGEGGNGDAEGSSGEGTGTGEGGQPGDGNGDGKGEGAGGGWSDSNQIIDGETDYRDVIDNYYDIAMDILNNSSNYPPELVEFIKGYFGSI